MHRTERRPWPAGLLATVALFLSACSTLPAPEEAADQAAASTAWEEHARAVESIDSWRLEGRVGARNGDQGTNFSVEWRQSGDAFRIELSGPLGQGAARIEGAPGQVSLTTADGTVHARSTEGLLARTTTIDLPLEALPYWLRGIPVPDTESDLTLDTESRLLHLRQNGWTIQYQAYHQDPELPQRLTLEQGDQRARILIDHWTTQPRETANAGD